MFVKNYMTSSVVAVMVHRQNHVLDAVNRDPKIY